MSNATTRVRSQSKPGMVSTEPAPPSALPAVPVGTLAPDERYRRIAEAAYFHSERRGFAPGCELDDWLVAEREVDAGDARQRTKSPA